MYFAFTHENFFYCMKSTHIIIVLIGLLPFLGFSQKIPRYALVIGNSNYLDQGKLKNPVNDAKLMRDSLIACGFRVISKENLTIAGFDDAINQFFDSIKNRNCEAFFYYSGHGIQNSGENYLIPVNAKLTSESDIANNCFPLNKVLGKMDDSRSLVNIIVLDACRNDPFSKGWTRGPGDKGLKVVSKTPHESFIIYATAPNEVANDGHTSNSPLATAFAKYMTEPGLSVNELLIKIIRDVNEQYPKQRPWGSVSIKKEFYFVPQDASVGTGVGSRKASFVDTKETGDIIIFTNLASTIYINGEKIEEVNTNSSLKVARYPGEYSIRAVSLVDSTVHIDTVLSSILNDLTVNYLDLAQKAQDKKDSIENAPAQKALKAAISGIKSNMIRLRGGSFTMGKVSGDNNEAPEHVVDIKQFYLSRYEITNSDWNAVLPEEPAKGAICPDCPVENISWNDIERFLKKLNELTHENYRLPTEAEWEFAAKGGIQSVNNAFSGGSKVDKYGWFNSNSSGKSHSVGTKSANELGLFDLTGNVAEWCSDWYDGTYYNKSERNNPAGPKSGKEKVVRGGSWDDYDINSRNTYRTSHQPTYKDNRIGFRLALDLN